MAGAGGGGGEWKPFFLCGIRAHYVPGMELLVSKTAWASVGMDDGSLSLQGYQQHICYHHLITIFLALDENMLHTLHTRCLPGTVLQNFSSFSLLFCFPYLITAQRITSLLCVEHFWSELKKMFC